jgi:hypothetical protein
MRQKNRLFLYLLALLSLTPINSLAWDGARQGFLLGLGAGIGQLNYNNVQFSHISPTPEDNKTHAITLMPKIGYAFTDQFALVYSRHPFKFSQKNTNNSQIFLTSCVESIEVHFYSNPDAPSIYFGAGTGYSHLFKDEINEPGAITGNGSIVTIGYEFSAHYSFELTYTHATPHTGGNITGISITLSALGY